MDNSDDYKIIVSLGLVCSGRMCDLQKLRDDVAEKYPHVKLVFHQINSEHLYIVKKSRMTPELLETVESKKGGK